MKQNFNYHGHTKRCGHAVGEDEEYVQAGVRQLKIHKSSKSGLVAAFFVSSP